MTNEKTYELPYEVQQAIQELRYKVQELGRTIDYLANGATKNDALKATDQWNVVINLAPKTLRRVLGATLEYTCPTCGHLLCCHKENQYGRKYS